MERKTLNTKFGEISYLIRNGEKYLILLHGLGGRGNNFLTLASKIDKRCGIILPDLLGHGKSAKLMDITIEMQSNMINEMIHILQLKNYFIGGNSYGGWVALFHEVNYGTSEGIILLDNAGTNPTVGDQGEESVERFMDRIRRVTPNNNMNVIESIVRKNSGNGYKINEKDLMDLNMPAMIIWGEEDTMISKSYGERMSELIKNSKLHILTGIGHTPHVKATEKVSVLINDFLDRK